MKETTTEARADIVERLPWHMPAVQHLLISQATADFVKDTSYEDSFVKGAGYPPNS